MNESQPPHVFVPSPSHSHAITLAVTRSKKGGQTFPPPPPLHTDPLHPSKAGTEVAAATPDSHINKLKPPLHPAGTVPSQADAQKVLAVGVQARLADTPGPRAAGSEDSTYWGQTRVAPRLSDMAYSINQGMPSTSIELNEKVKTSATNFDSLFLGLAQRKSRPFVLLNIVTIVFKICRKRSFKGAALDLETRDEYQALSLWHWAFSMQWGAEEGLKAGKYDNLVPQVVDGLIMVKGRLSDTAKDKFGLPKLFILISQHQHPFLACAISWLHATRGHLGSGKLVSYLMPSWGFWLPAGRRKCRRVTEKCFHCRRQNHKLVNVAMAGLDPLRLETGGVAFANYVMVDLWGPLKCRDSVAKRSTRANRTSKCWGVAYVCCTSGAIHGEVSDGYSADSLLICFRRYLALRGCPRQFCSDAGSNLLALMTSSTGAPVSPDHQSTSQEEEIRPASSYTFLKNRLAVFCAARFEVTPINSHFTAQVEACIKQITKTLYSVLRGQTLTFPQLSSAVYECCSIVNQRPIGLISTAKDLQQLQPLTPNDLLLGRASGGHPFPKLRQGTLLESYTRVKTVINNFWERWVDECLPQLHQRQKWHKSDAGPEVGDIAYWATPSIVGDFQLCKIVDCKQDESAAFINDGKVRSCTVAYVSKSGKVRSRDVSVRHLSIIVPCDYVNESLADGQKTDRQQKVTTTDHGDHTLEINRNSDTVSTEVDGGQREFSPPPEGWLERCHAAPQPASPEGRSSHIQDVSHLLE